MRRILLIVVPLILIAAGVWWFFLRLTPEKALKTAFINLSKAETVKNLRVSTLDVVQGPGGEGLVLGKQLKFSGSVDLRDPSRIRALGTVGYSETGREADLQYAEAVLTDDRAAFKLMDVSEPVEQWFAEHSGTSTEDRWFDFDRNTLLEKKLSPEWVAVGDGSDLRSAIREIGLDAWAVPKEGIIEDYNGRRVMTIRPDPQEYSIERGFVSLMAAWFLRDPTDMEIHSASQAVKSINEGDWSVIIDIETEQFLLIQGVLPLFDEDDNAYGRRNVEVWMSGFNVPVAIEAPEGAVDMTPFIDDAGPGTFTPAGERVLPPLVPAEDERDAESETAP